MSGFELFNIFGTVTINDKEANRSIDSISNNAERSSKSMANAFSLVTKAVAGVGAGLVAVGIASIKTASDFEETQNKFNTAFRGIEERAEKTAETLANSYRLSQLESKKLLSDTADLLKGFGFTADEALNLSLKTQELSADLASYNNIQGGTKRASEIMTKALLGERDALVSLGIKVSEEDVKRRIMEKGMQDLTGTAMMSARAMATYELAIQQSGDALGDTERSTGSFKANLDEFLVVLSDVRVEIGQELLPVATEFLRLIVSYKEDIIDVGKTFTSVFGSMIEGFRTIMNISEFIQLGATTKDLEKINEAMHELQMNSKVSKNLFDLGEQIDTISNLRTVKSVSDDVKDTTREISSEFRNLQREISAATDEFGNLNVDELLNKISSLDLKHITTDVVPVFDSITKTYKNTVAFSIEKETSQAIQNGLSPAAAFSMSAIDDVILAVGTTAEKASMIAGEKIGLDLTKSINDTLNIDSEKITKSIEDGLNGVDWAKFSKLADFSDNYKTGVPGAKPSDMPEKVSNSEKWSEIYGMSEDEYFSEEGMERGMSGVDKLSKKFKDSFQGIADSVAVSIGDVTASVLMGTGSWSDLLTSFSGIFQSIMADMITQWVTSLIMSEAVQESWLVTTLSTMGEAASAYISTAYAGLLAFFSFAGPLAPLLAGGVIASAIIAVAALGVKIAKSIGGGGGGSSKAGATSTSSSSSSPSYSSPSHSSSSDGDLFTLLAPLSNFNNLVNINKQILDVLSTKLSNGFGGGSSMSFGNINITLGSGNAQEISKELFDAIEDEMAIRQSNNRRRFAI